MYRTFMQAFHNGSLLRKAEGIINGLLDGGAYTHMYIVNPDGTKVRLQYGLRIENGESVSTVVEENRLLE